MSDLLILAAGSTRHLLPHLLSQYCTDTKQKFHCEYGISSSFKSKIEMGAKFSLFVSASSAHTESLGLSGKLRRYDMLGCNRLVLLHRKTQKILGNNVLIVFSDPSLSLGLSTTGFDPTIGASEIIEKVCRAAEIRPCELKSRTRIITGGREKPNAPTNRNQYGWIMETQDIDLILTIQSNAIDAIDDNPRLKFSKLPLSIETVMRYGLGLANAATNEAEELFDWLLNNNTAREILIERGFSF